MSDNFKLYAQYYDLLYRDKDYQSEVDYIDELIKANAVKPVKTILDLGCGTGRHDVFLSQKGYKIKGVDLSDQMIQIANDKKTEDLDFILGDVRNVQLNEKFDVVVSLFHVASYQIENNDVMDYLNTASKHLDDGGICIFDFWYGPGVLTDRPEKREKTLENESLKVTRYAKPELHINANVVDVNYDIGILDKQSHNTTKIAEKHVMRYFFFKELAYYLQAANFGVEAFYNWMTFDQPDTNSWNAVIVAKKSSS